MTIQRTKNLIFLLLVCGTFVASQKGLLADQWQPVRDFCEGYENGDGYDCTECSVDTGYPPTFSADGECDFSGIEDEEALEMQAAAYTQDAYDACDEICTDSEYADYIASWYEFFGNPFDPCYDAQVDGECWFTWTHFDGDAGPYSTWGCECERYNFCECS